MYDPRIMIAFVNEMEKDAQWAMAFRTMFRGAKAAFGKGGLKGALGHLARFRDPIHLVGSKGLGKSLRVMSQQRIKPTLARGIRTSIGNTAANIQGLTAGMRGKGVFGKSWQFIKNIGTTGAGQLRGAKFKEVSLSRLDSKGVLRGRGLLGKYTNFNRKPVSFTNRGTAIVAKRKAIRPLSYAFTAPGFALTTGMATSGSPAKRLGAAAREGALWGISPPLGMASIIRSQLKEMKAPTTF